MIQEIEEGNIHHPTQETTPMYSFKDIQIQDEKSILIYFLRHLTFDAPEDTIWEDLTSEQIVRLKQLIDKIYTSYKSNKRIKSQLQGLWSLLIFSFGHRNGLSLYLYFQKIIQPEPEAQLRAASSEVKQEYIQFQPKQYFRKNNQWIKDKHFLQAITVLETHSQGLNIESLSKFCYIFFEQVHTEVDYLCISRQFQQKYSTFKTKVIKSSKQTKVNKVIFNDRFCNENVVFSEPDVINTFQYFTKNQFLLNQSYSRANIIIDVKNKCKTVIQQISEQEQNMEDSIIIQPDHSHPTSTISIPKNNQLTTFSKSSITKKIVSYQREKSVKRHQKLIRRMPRYKFIEKLYEIEDKKNILLQDLKNKRKKQVQIKKKNKKLHRIHRINYYSDEQEMMESSGRQNQKSRRRRMEIESADEDSRYSMSDHSIGKRDYDNEESYKQAHKKAKNKRKLQKICPTNRIDQNYFVVPDDQFQQQSFRAQQNQQSIERSFIQKIEMLNLKEDHSLQYLKKVKQIRFDRKPSQKIQNMEIRKLNLDQAQNIVLMVDLHAYLEYLSRLENDKEIRREVINVAKQFTTFQENVMNIDIMIKIIALLIISEDKANPTFTIWLKYRESYIVPMLKYSINMNVYYLLSQIINNLFVSFCNEDLTILTKYKQFFAILFNISHRFNHLINLEAKLVELIYQALPTQRAKQINLSQKSHIVLANPLIIGTSNMKFALSQTDQQIALMIANFVFDNLFLYPLINNEVQQCQYIQRFIKDIVDEQNKGPIAWMYCFVDFLKKFHQIYKPSMNYQYFKNIVILIGISTSQLSIDLINSENGSEINKHVQFLRYIFQEYIHFEFSKNEQVNCLQLLNKLIIQNQFKKKYEEPKNSISIIIYSNILALIMAFPHFKENNNIQKFVFKYPKQKLFGNMDQIISKMQLNVSSSIFKIVYVIYQAKITEKIKEENDSFSMILTPTQILTELSEKYQDIRKIIQLIYAKIDKKYDEIQIRLKECEGYYKALNNNKYSAGQHKKRLDDMDQIKSGLAKCQDIIGLFLDIFILNPQQSHSDHEFCNLRTSISHFFFVLQFIVSQNFFMKYFVNKFKTSNTAALTQKYSQILQYWLDKVPHCTNFLTSFSHHPQKTEAYEDIDVDFLIKQKRYLKNQQLSIWFFRILFSVNSNMKLDLYETLTRLDNKHHWESISRIYGIHLIGSMQIIQRRALSQQNILCKYLQQSVNPNSISVEKVQKSILILNFLFRQISNFIKNKERDDRSVNAANSNQKIMEIKRYLAQKIMMKLAKEIVIIIVAGFCLKNLSQYQQLPLQQLILHFKSLKLIQDSMGLQKNGQIYFLLALEKSQRENSIADILCEFSNLFPKFREVKQFSSSISKMLIDWQIVLRKLQDKSNQKWHITLQSIKILTFIIKRSAELQIECLKKYLIEMQVISNGGSLICKIKINQNTMLLLILFFNQIELLKVNPYSIKSTRDRYVDQICPNKFTSKHSEDQNLKQMVNIFISVRQCLKKNQDITQIASPFFYHLIKTFCQPLFLLQESICLSNRLDIYLQMMENSDQERRIYQNYFITNKEKFNRLINLTKDTKRDNSSRQIATLENAVIKCMIGQHSDFYQIHKLISPLIDKNSDTVMMIKIIQKFLWYLQKTNGNYVLIIWARDQIDSINKKKQQADRSKKREEDYSEWMDIESQ